MPAVLTAHCGGALAYVRTICGECRFNYCEPIYDSALHRVRLLLTNALALLHSCFPIEFTLFRDRLSDSLPVLPFSTRPISGKLAEFLLFIDECCCKLGGFPDCRYLHAGVSICLHLFVIIATFRIAGTYRAT